MSEELLSASSVSSKPQDTPIDDVVISLDVVLGETEMALHELLRLGRGAVIALNTTEDDDVRILAGNTQIASGQLRLNGEQVEVTVTENQLRGKSFRAPSDKFVQEAEAAQ
ncbi:MAG: FliM/FliN family flagellar motor switch protein [Hyphomicrobiales bacterium]